MNCRIYLSGTYKDVTDHLLKTEIPRHGGVVLSFDVTAAHVIVAGGMFAAGKMDKRLNKREINGQSISRLNGWAIIWGRFLLGLCATRVLLLKMDTYDFLLVMIINVCRLYIGDGNL